jgi:NTP pyrophosphatase (non-canonical NTP hydrolase)
MKEREYKDSVEKLMNASLSFDEKLVNFALGLVCETGELAEAIISGNENKILDEFSDCRWYFTASGLLLQYSQYLELYDEYFGIDEYTGTTETDLLITACRYGDLIKKVIYHKHPLERHEAQLRENLLRYYLGYRDLIQKFNLTDEDIKQYNVNKLSARYQGLTFTSEQSLNRTA